MITLPSGNHANAFLLAALEPILPRKLDCRFGGFRSARSEKHPAVRLHRLRSKRKNSPCQFFRHSCVVLRGVNVRQPPRLLRHRLRHFFHAVPNRDDRRAAGGVQVPSPLRRKHKTSFAPHRLGICLQEISGEDGFVHRSPPSALRLLSRSHLACPAPAAQCRAILAEKLPRQGNPPRRLTSISDFSRQSSAAGISCASPRASRRRCAKRRDCGTISYSRE